MNRFKYLVFYTFIDEDGFQGSTTSTVYDNCKINSQNRVSKMEKHLEEVNNFESINIQQLTLISRRKRIK